MISVCFMPVFKKMALFSEQQPEGDENEEGMREVNKQILVL